MRAPIGALLAVAVLIAAAGAGDDAVKGEWKKFNGTWIAIAMEKEGKKLSEEEIKGLDLQLILKDDKYTVKVGSNVIDTGTSKPDPTKKPKTVDVMPSEGPNKGKTIKGIYELDGDSLRVCYDLAGKGRPKALATKADSGQVLIVYKRATE
jgi:uncharacterized protein (TIGR03067 family)